MRQLGVEAEEHLGKPLIVILNTWSELNPCHMHLRQRAEQVKRGVLEAGGFPVEMPVATLSETFQKPRAGAVEDWVYINLTGDTHPMHVHLVNFQVIGRTLTLDKDLVTVIGALEERAGKKLDKFAIGDKDAAQAIVLGEERVGVPLDEVGRFLVGAGRDCMGGEHDGHAAGVLHGLLQEALDGDAGLGQGGQDADGLGREFAM